MTKRLLLLLLLLSGWFTLAWGDIPAWQDLSEVQRQMLEPFSGRWDSLPETRRQRLLTGLERWQGMSREERESVR